MNKFSRIIVSSLFLFASSVFADIARVNVSSSGEQANDFLVSSGSISDDGRYIAFSSRANNLVVDDTNAEDDVFVHDTETGTTERVSVSSSGGQANGASRKTIMSGNGRFVIYESLASNLVADDTNNEQDIFVYDRETGVTERISVSPDGFRISDKSDISSLSDDGRFLAFSSSAANLVIDDTNAVDDAFVYDRETGTTERISLASGGNQANNRSLIPAISGDGRFVAFKSFATDMVIGDTNEFDDVFIHDRDTGITERISVSSSGLQGNGKLLSSVLISDDGRFVAFSSLANNLVEGDTNHTVDAFVHDRETGITERVSVTSQGVQGKNVSTIRSISDDGRFVPFSSLANNLVEGDTNAAEDVFIHDRETGTTERFSLTSANAQGNGSSSAALISGNGRFIKFSSLADNLVPNDTNNLLDQFITENPLADSSSNLISIAMMINGAVRETVDDAAQLLTGSLFEVKYKVTNNSPDRLTGVQIFEAGELVCNVYGLDPGQTKQPYHCATNSTVMSGANHVKANVTGKVAGTQTIITNTMNTYYTGIDSVTGKLRVTHRINNINADNESQPPTLDFSQASILFKVENTGDIELYRVKTYHDPASPVNSGWDQQCFIGTLTPGQIRYCKRDITFSNSGLHKAWGRVQGKSANVSPTGAVNAANPTYFIVP